MGWFLHRFDAALLVLLLMLFSSHPIPFRVRRYSSHVYKHVVVRVMCVMCLYSGHDRLEHVLYESFSRR